MDANKRRRCGRFRIVVRCLDGTEIRCAGVWQQVYSVTGGIDECAWRFRRDFRGPCGLGRPRPADRRGLVRVCVCVCVCGGLEVKDRSMMDLSWCGRTGIGGWVGGEGGGGGVGEAIRDGDSSSFFFFGAAVCLSACLPAWLAAPEARDGEI
ncbi:hypothetical protein LX36DRAFT_332723 [Colletotrichum falcatum]|nr:hypothetical protein LX36DRAFT_332723 [Colletotrichum falcatum]